MFYGYAYEYTSDSQVFNKNEWYSMKYLDLLSTCFLKQCHF